MGLEMITIIMRLIFTLRRQKPKWEVIMPNLDYPGTGLCSSCNSSECFEMPYDYNALRGVLTRDASGYTMTIIRDIMYAFPDKFETVEEAAMLLDVVKTVIVNGLKNGDTVSLEGLGAFRTSGSGARRTIGFTPERVLCDAVHE